MNFESNFSVAYFKKPKKWVMLLETLIITGLICFLAYALNPQDPFGLNAVGFPWIVVIPLFCTLFFSTVYGILSLLIVFLFYVALYPHAMFTDFATRDFFAGNLIFIIMGGLFSSFWHRRVDHVEHLNYYLRVHLENLSKDYYLLKLSHDRLEHSYISKTMSFREAVYSLKTKFESAKFKLSSETALEFLTLISQYCLINNAAIILVHNKTHDVNALTYLGQEFPIHMDDPLIHAIVKNKQSHYLSPSNYSYAKNTAYLAAIPLRKNNDVLFGFLLIKDMPFMELNHENMEALSVFCSILMLNADLPDDLQTMLTHVDSSKQALLIELYHAWKLKRNHGVESGMAGISIPNSTIQEQILYGIKQNKRALDYFSVEHKDNALYVYILLPLTTLEGCFGFQKRLAFWLKEEFGLQLNRNGLYYRFRMVDDLNPEQQLNQLGEELFNEFR